jgi:hypothetical protein
MRETAPNKALEPTASSFGFAYASGGGSPRAFGVYVVDIRLNKAGTMPAGCGECSQRREPQAGLAK